MPAGCSPSTSIVPDVGRRRPTARWSKVDLPAPFDPDQSRRPWEGHTRVQSERRRVTSVALAEGAAAMAALTLRPLKGGIERFPGRALRCSRRRVRAGRFDEPALRSWRRGPWAARDGSLAFRSRRCRRPVGARDLMLSSERLEHGAGLMANRATTSFTSGADPSESPSNAGALVNDCKYGATPSGCQRNRQPVKPTGTVRRVPSAAPALRGDRRGRARRVRGGPAGRRRDARDRAGGGPAWPRHQPMELRLAELQRQGPPALPRPQPRRDPGLGRAGARAGRRGLVPSGRTCRAGDSEAGRAELAARVQRLAEWGYPARLIDAAEAVTIEPALQLSWPQAAAAWFPEEAYLLTEPLIERLIGRARHAAPRS